jgi:hypothetical protein
MATASSLHPAHGTFILSLALPSAASHSHEAKEHVAGVIRRVRGFQIAATWAVPLGTNLAQLADLVGVASNELAWLADASWAGRNVGRGRFAVALAERSAAALEADLSVSTLVLDTLAPTHLDVAAKYGIRAVVHENAGRSAQPHVLRYGVWNVAPTARVDGGGSWWTNQARRAVADVDRAIGGGNVCHVHANLDRVEALAVLERILAHVQRRRVEGRLRIETVAQAAARLARPKVAARPAHSILRAA